MNFNFVFLGGVCWWLNLSNTALGSKSVNAISINMVDFTVDVSLPLINRGKLKISKVAVDIEFFLVWTQRKKKKAVAGRRYLTVQIHNPSTVY